MKRGKGENSFLIQYRAVKNKAVSEVSNEFGQPPKFRQIVALIA
jgi:hypothetical protein